MTLRGRCACALAERGPRARSIAYTGSIRPEPAGRHRRRGKR
ncbi:hypothetical protein BURMUCF1_A0459 [Burkholderia multivorans ATCC BAA-247]|nr:hypothetical protein BURMUCF1_A0459 [Burkholderia multivorans ATCC BAA-247]